MRYRVKNCLGWNHTEGQHLKAGQEPLSANQVGRHGRKRRREKDINIFHSYQGRKSYQKQTTAQVSSHELDFIFSLQFQNILQLILSILLRFTVLLLLFPTLIAVSPKFITISHIHLFPCTRKIPEPGKCYFVNNLNF